MTSIATSGIYDAVRLDIGDPEGQIFNDAFLQRIFIKAVRRLNQTLGTSATSRPRGIPGYKSLSVEQITYDLANDSISPDNDEIADLIILQMEYIIAKGEVAALKRLNSSYGGAYSTGSNVSNDDVEVTNADGVKIKMGAGRLNNRTRLMLENANMIRKELNDAVKRFLTRMSGNFGKCIF